MLCKWLNIIITFRTSGTSVSAQRCGFYLCPKDTNSTAAIIKILQSADAPEDEHSTSPAREISMDVGPNEGLIENTEDLLKELSFLEKQTMEGDSGGVGNEVEKSLPLWENISNTEKSIQEPNNVEHQEVAEEKGDVGNNGSVITEDKEQEVSGREQVKTLGASHHIAMNTRSRGHNQGLY